MKKDVGVLMSIQFKVSEKFLETIYLAKFATDLDIAMSVSDEKDERLAYECTFHNYIQDKWGCDTAESEFNDSNNYVIEGYQLIKLCNI